MVLSQCFVPAFCFGLIFPIARYTMNGSDHVRYTCKIVLLIMIWSVHPRRDKSQEPRLRSKTLIGAMWNEDKLLKKYASYVCIGLVNKHDYVVIKWKPLLRWILNKSDQEILSTNFTQMHSYVMSRTNTTASQNRAFALSLGDQRTHSPGDIWECLSKLVHYLECLLLSTCHVW